MNVLYDIVTRETWEDAYLVQNEKQLQAKSIDTTQIQFGESKSFIGFPYRNLGKGLTVGAEMTKRELCRQKPSHSHYTCVGSSTGWRVFFFSR